MINHVQPCFANSILTKLFRKIIPTQLDSKYCLINEQECFIGFKTTRRSRVVLDPIKHDLRVY